MVTFAIGIVVAGAVGMKFCGLFMGQGHGRGPQWNKRSKKFV